MIRKLILASALLTALIAVGQSSSAVACGGPYGLVLSAELHTVMSRNGQFVAGFGPMDAQGGSKLNITEVKTGKVISSFTIEKKDRPSLSIMAVSDNGGKLLMRRLLPGKEIGHEVELWLKGLASPIALGKLPTIGGSVGAFHPNGSTMVVGDMAGNIHLHRFGCGILSTILVKANSCPKAQQPVRYLAFSADGKFLVSQSTRLRVPSGEVKVINMATQKVVFETGEVTNAVALSADGQFLATADISNKEVTIWDVKQGTVLRKIAADKTNVQSLSFSSDGKRLAAVVNTGEVKLWDAVSGKLVLTINEHGNPARRVAFSSDGQELLVIRRNNTLKSWSLS